METSSLVILIVLGTCLISLFSMRYTEQFDVQGAAKAAAKNVAPKLPAQPKVVRGITLTNVTVTKSSPDFTEKWFKGRSKAVIIKAAPKHTLSNNTQLIGPKYMYVKGHGKTQADAEADARLQARKVLDETMKQLRSQNLA